MTKLSNFRLGEELDAKLEARSREAGCTRTAFLKFWLAGICDLPGDTKQKIEHYATRKGLYTSEAIAEIINGRVNRPPKPPRKL